MLFISPQKLFLFSRYLNFCFLVIYQKGLIKKIKVNFKFYHVTAWLTNNCNTHIAQYFQSIFYIRISTKKQAFDFPKTNSYTNACLKFLCDAKLITSPLIFLILSKNLKGVYLSFHWFNDSQTRGFELVTRVFELVPRGFELVTHGFELITRGFELVTREFELVTCGWTRGFELVTRRFELVARGFELLTRGFELVTRRFELTRLNFNSCFYIINSCF